MYKRQGNPQVPDGDDPSAAWGALGGLNDCAKADPEPGEPGLGVNGRSCLELRALMQRQGVEGATRGAHVVMLAAQLRVT